MVGSDNRLDARKSRDRAVKRAGLGVAVLPDWLLGLQLAR